MFQKGDLLVSEPFMSDPNFFRSVIVLCDCTDNGSLGFVLNQASNYKLCDLGEDFEELDIPVYIGGPVEQNTLHFLHALGPELDGSVTVRHGLYWSGNVLQLVQWFRLGIVKEKDVRFFLGYSGWSKGQLESEMREKTWIHIPNYHENLFEKDPLQLWRNILREQGGKFKEISNYPIDPRLN